MKWILRYLKGSQELSLFFGKGNSLQGYVYADLGGDVDSSRSTTGYVFTCGGTTISWISQLKKVLDLSTTEAEYIAITEAGKEMVWLEDFLEDMDRKREDALLHSDSQSAIHLANNPVFHDRTKHIPLKYHFFRTLIQDGILTLQKIIGTKNPIDMLTNPMVI